MPTRTAALVLAVLALVPVVVVSSPQQEQPRPVFKADVELVQIDVSVVEADGRPIRGLTKDDFSIVDRKRRQRVDTCSEISHIWERPPAPPLADVKSDVSDNSSAAAERVVVLVIDDRNIWQERAALVRDLVRRLINDLSHEASIAMVFASGRGGVEPTSDRAMLLAAIWTLTGEPHAGRVRGGCSPQHNPRGCYVFATIKDAARALAIEDSRRKAFILISEGQAVDIQGLFDTMTSRVPLNSLQNPKYVAWHDYALLDMMDALRRANATLYAIDPRGRLRTSEERSRESRGESDGLRMFDPLYLSQEGLRLTAEASGGFAVVDTNDFSAGLRRIVSDLDNYYLLGFYPETPTDRKWHEIEVTVNRPGVTVRHRKGYRLGNPPPLPKNKDPLVALSAGVLPRSALPLRIFATPVGVLGKTARVAVAVEVRAPFAVVAEAGGRARDALSATILAVDLKKKKVTRRVNRQADVLVAEPRVSASGAVSYHLVMAIDLPPGQYQLRTSVASDRLQKAGSVYLAVDVPAAPKSGLAIAGLAVGLASRGPNPVAQAADSPLPIRPVFDRVFNPGDTLRVVYWIARKESTPVVSSRVDILNRQDEIVLTVEGRDELGVDGLVERAVRLSSLIPGSYRLRVTARGGAGSATRELGFAVREASP